jgi:hypothetical protein
VGDDEARCDVIPVLIEVAIMTGFSMRKLSRALLGTTALIAAVAQMAAQAQAEEYDGDYARDRAQIEDLQARYLFAMNWGDFATYASTFAEDGVLDWARGTAVGRDAIREEAEVLWQVFSGLEAGEAATTAPVRRHFIANQVLDIDGDTATGRAYWYEFDVEPTARQPYVIAYGHYEDELRKVDGKWLFSRRKIYNVILEGREGPPENPAW